MLLIVPDDLLRKGRISMAKIATAGRTEAGSANHDSTRAEFQNSG